MKKFLLRVSLAGAFTLAAIALTPNSSALSWQDPATANPPEQPAAPPPASTAPQQRDDAQMPVQDDQMTQTAQAFSGRIVKEKGQLVLKDTVRKSATSSTIRPRPGSIWGSK
jgi:hypothetical protein